MQDTAGGGFPAGQFHVQVMRLPGARIWQWLLPVTSGNDVQVLYC
jgi:hypothetical protein